MKFVTIICLGEIVKFPKIEMKWTVELVVWGISSLVV